jgi:hypothetical protein
MIRDLKDLRREAVELTQEFTAIALLTNSIEKQALAKLADVEAQLMTSTSRKDLRAYIKVRRADVASWRADKHVQASRQELIELLQGIRAAPDGQLAYVRKAYLAKLIGIYDHYPWPAHCQIGFPKEGIDLKHWVIEWRLLEALLYEDLCALYNLSLDFAEKPDDRADSRVRFKQGEALRRAVVTAAFYFLESYLNGLAYDFRATTSRSLNERELELLTEWDTARNVPRYARFRDKLIQYPRIILDREHPPLQENNCEPLAFMLEQIKTLRDAIVHASPVTLKPSEAMSSKELAIFDMAPELIDMIVDKTIELVRTIERTIRGDDKFLDWLKERENGRFPETAFS